MWECVAMNAHLQLCAGIQVGATDDFFHVYPFGITQEGHQPPIIYHVMQFTRTCKATALTSLTTPASDGTPAMSRRNPPFAHGKKDPTQAQRSRLTIADFP